MRTRPPMRHGKTYEEWCRLTQAVGPEQPIAVTEWEWTDLCRMLDWPKESRFRVRLFDRRVVVVTGEPAWFLTNT